MTKNPIYEARLEKVEKAMETIGVKCLLLNKSITIKYLTGANNTCSWVFLCADKKRVGPGAGIGQ